EATDRLAASRGGEKLTVTASVTLASMWLGGPRRAFAPRSSTGASRGCVPPAHRPALAGDRPGLPTRWGPPGSSVPGGEPLFDMEIFPVCSPTLARDRARPLRNPADLANHVLLDLETVTTRGPWPDWGPWLEAMKLGELKPAGTLRFSHYDQVVQAA